MSSTPTAEERAEAIYRDPSADEMRVLAMDSEVLYQTGRGIGLCRAAYAKCIREEVEPLEAEVVKLRALVQELVNLMQDGMDDYGDYPCFLNGLEEAKSQGFTPTNTTEG